jgi:hypothetical protein
MLASLVYTELVITWFWLFFPSILKKKKLRGGLVSGMKIEKKKESIF